MKRETGKIGWMLLIIAILGVAAPRFAGAQTPREGEKAVAGKVAKSDTGTEKENDKRYVSIDFNNVDIQVFIKFMSELTGRNFIVDDKVKGKVTIISPGKISVDEAYKVFESVLEVHGYATVDAGEVTKIVMAPDARSKNVETLLRQSAREADDRVVTQIIPLKYADANEVKRLLTPLISKSSVMLSYPQTNMLIITDNYSNIVRLMRIIEAIDVTGIGREISIIPLQAADAVNMVKMLSTIFQEQHGRKPPATVDDSTKFVADERTNTIVLLASEVDTLRAKKLIKMLDKEVPRGTEKIHVYYLEYAVAEDLAQVLQMLPKEKQAQKAGKKEAPVVSGETKITADKATNSLIIMADKDDYAALETIIQKLDIPRSMVYIECLIMEVDVTKSFALGTEWMVTGEATASSGDSAAVGGGFSGSAAGYTNLARTLATAASDTGIATYPPGMSMGIFAETIKINGITFPSLAAVIQAAKNDSGVHILQTPQLITTDNEEATINVGQNIPFLTKTGTTSTTETYQNYEYKDVSTILKVTPQVSKGQLVRLKVSLEVTKLDQSATNALIENQTPVTFKRTLDTTVIVDDKNTLVIGGLIDDQLDSQKYHIPCLSDIPMMGWLFKSISESSNKTNLYVFLTPHVVTSAEEVKAINDKKRVEIDRIMKEGKIKMYEGASGLLGITQEQPDELKPVGGDEEETGTPAEAPAE